MAENSHISWTTHTFNPWHGCQKVSPGCQNCYMFAWKKRIGQEGTDRRRTVDWKKPLRWNSNVSEWPRCCPSCGALCVQDSPEDTHCPDCDRRLIPHRPKVFPSLCDWLDDKVPIEWLADFLKLIHDTPNLDWLLLTKRPENFEDRLRAAELWLVDGPREYDDPRVKTSQWISKWRHAHDPAEGDKAPANVWLGVSVENQKYADERIPLLLEIPAKVHFLSVEPLLGPIEFSEVSKRSDAVKQLGKKALDGIHWVISGMESGPNRRDSTNGVADLIDIGEQCSRAGVPFFCKQDLALKPGQQGRIPNHIFAMKEFPA